MKKSLEPVRLLLAYSLLGVLLLLFVPFEALAEPVEGDAAGGVDRITYDQRQSGKYNIHVSIKDVAIIEMDQNEIEDDSYNEEDYYYDEGDLTVKPLPTRSTSTTQAANQNHTTRMTTTTTSATTGLPLPTLSQELPTISTTIPEFLLTTIHNHNYSTSYSPNLLADIVATQAAANNNNNNNNGNTLVNTTAAVPTIMTTPYAINAHRTPTPNVVILESSATTEPHSPTSTHKPPVQPVKVVAARTKEIPVIMEPLLLPRQRYTPTTMRLNSAFMPQEKPTQLENSADQASKMPNEDSKIFKFKVRRAQKLAYPGPAAFGSGSAPYFAAGNMGRRCRSHQYRDVSGNCRHKRSSSILKKLFRMLVSLPFANERDDQTNE